MAFTRGDGRAARPLHAMKQTLPSEGGPLASEDVPTATGGTRRATRMTQEPGQGLRQFFLGSCLAAPALSTAAASRSGVASVLTTSSNSSLAG